MPVEISNALDETLEKFGLLVTGDPVPKSDDSKTPESLQVIKSGSLYLSRMWARIVAGGGALLGGAIPAWFVDDANMPLQIALVSAGGIVIAASVIAVALIVLGDIRSRAQTESARYYARGEVAAQYVRVIGNTQNPPSPPPLASHPDGADRHEAGPYSPAGAVGA